MSTYDLVFSIVAYIVLALASASLGAISVMAIDRINEARKKKRFKKIVLDILSKEDDKSALDIIADEYVKSHFNEGTFSSLVGNIATELRYGDYLKYYDVSIDDPMALAKRLDSIIRMYDDKGVIERFEQSDLIKELGIGSDKQMTRQDILMVYGKINAYYLGRIHEKDSEIDKLNKKLTKASIGRGLAILGWIVGIVSGVLTIVTYFFK